MKYAQKSRADLPNCKLKNASTHVGGQMLKRIDVFWGKTRPIESQPSSWLAHVLSHRWPCGSQVRVPEELLLLRLGLGIYRDVYCTQGQGLAS